MKSIKYILFGIFLWISCSVFSQKDSTKVKTQIKTKATQYNPLSPAKAAFYSAIFPGAGQIYNKRYWWQLPLIYGGIGATAYFYLDNNREYNRYRTAYRLRKAGLPDEFTDIATGRQIVSDAGLENAQRQLKKSRDLSLFSAILVYVLQIVEASVTAHLLQFDTTENISLSPITIPNPTFDRLPKIGLTIKYSF